jgi:hypothetical protein
MKPLILIPAITAGFFAAVVALLMVCGVRLHTPEPLAATIICCGAGALGIVPLAAGRRKDPVGVFQLALVGTVLHLFAAVAFTGVALGTHLVAIRMPFIYWLLAGYWVSLTLLLWQLRQRLLSTLDATTQGITTEGITKQGIITPGMTTRGVTKGATIS